VNYLSKARLIYVLVMAVMLATMLAKVNPRWQAGFSDGP
jgi:hypothetical protein